MRFPYEEPVVTTQDPIRHFPDELNLRGAHILIADALPSNLDILHRILEAAGYTVSGVPSGHLVLEIAQRVVPDLILLDESMPGMDGFEVCRRLKQMEATQEIPVIFLTAREEREERLAGLRVGGVDYIVKPFQVEEVLARVRTHLQVSRFTRVVRGREVGGRAGESGAGAGGPPA
jgi:DNA-binding response OmpR family regulator